MAVSSGLAVVDTIRGADFQARQLLLALEAGEPRRVVRALAMETAYVAIGGTKTRRRTDKLLEHARAVARRLNEPQGTGLTIWASGMASFLGGRWSQAQEQFAQAEQIFREKCTGVAWELDTARFISLWSSFYRGDVLDLERRTPAFQRDSESRGDLYAVTNFRTAFMPFLHLVAGHPQAARREAEEAMARWSRQGFHIQHVNGMLAGVQADLYEGQGARALETLLALWPRMERSQLLYVQQIRVRAVHLRGCAGLAAGDAGRAERDARKLEAEKAPWAAALGDALRAGVLATQGDARAASEAYAHAASELTVSDMALYAAACRHRAADLVGGDLREVETWMQARKIREPEKLARLLAP
jgi:hypothetical protein